MNRQNRFLRNVGWQSMATAASAVCGFAYSILVARWLGPSMWGTLALALSLATVCFQLAELRLHEPVIRYLSKYLQEGDNPKVHAVVKLSFIADAVSGLVAFTLTLGAGLLLPLLRRWLNWFGGLERADFPIVVLAAFLMLTWNTSSATSRGILRSVGKFRPLAIVETCHSIGKVVFTAIAVWGFGAGVRGILWTAVVIAVTANASLVWIANQKLRERAPISAPAPIRLLHEEFREIRRFVSHVWLTNWTMLPLKDLDVLILGVYVSPHAVGAYKIARQFFSAVSLAFDPIVYTIYPEVTRLWLADRRQLGAFVKKTTKMLALAGVAITIVAAVTVPPFIHQVFGAQYDAAIIPFWYMLPGVVLWAPFVWVYGLYLAAGRSGTSFTIAFVSAIFLLVAYAVLVPPFGEIGASIVVGPCGAVGNLVALAWAKKIGLLEFETQAGDPPGGSVVRA